MPCSFPFCATYSGLDVNECMKRACAVTGEWQYRDGVPGADPWIGVFERLHRVREQEARVPLQLRTLAGMLSPQPKAEAVFKKLLDWMDRADVASLSKAARLEFLAADGSDIFPPSAEP